MTTKLKTQAQINNGIKGIGKSKSKLQDQVQGWLIEIAGFVLQHGNVCHAEPLLAEMKADAPRVAAWLAEYAFVVKKEGSYGVASLNRKAALADHSPVEDFVDGKPVANPAAARQAYQEWLATQRKWYEDPDADEGDKQRTKAVFDAVKKAELLIANIVDKTQKGEGTNLDLERYLRAAIEQYKADRKVFEAIKGA